jgi:molybdopterin biosynthesis enzyme
MTSSVSFAIRRRTSGPKHRDARACAGSPAHPDDAWSRVAERWCPPELPIESVPLLSALGRVTALAIRSALDSPPFDRAAMDGYAVRAADVQRCERLRIAGAVPTGSLAETMLAEGDAISVATGSMIPRGADAVVNVERTERADADIEISGAVDPGDNIVRRGEDVRCGAVVLSAGRRCGRKTSGCWRHLGEVKITLLSGGSSVGAKDLTIDVLGAIPGAAVVVDGVAAKPGRPSIVATEAERLVIGIPGNPVAAMVAFEMFGLRALARLLQIHPQETTLPRRRVRLEAFLEADIPSRLGRHDYARVMVRAAARGGSLATLVEGTSSHLSSMVRVDGFVVAPAEVDGLRAGHLVEVTMF